MVCGALSAVPRPEPAHPAGSPSARAFSSASALPHQPVNRYVAAACS